MRKAVLMILWAIATTSGPAARADVVVPIDTRLPEPGIAALQIGQYGTIERVEFTDGSVLPDPVEITPADLKSIDVLEFYHIPIDLLVLRDLSDSNLKVVPKCHVGSTFYKPCPQLVQLDKYGQPTGPYEGNLNSSSIDNVDFVEHRALRLIEYRNHGSSDVRRAILRD